MAASHGSRNPRPERNHFNSSFHIRPAPEVWLVWNGAFRPNTLCTGQLMNRFCAFRIILFELRHWSLCNAMFFLSFTPVEWIENKWDKLDVLVDTLAAVTTFKVLFIDYSFAAKIKRNSYYLVSYVTVLSSNLRYEIYLFDISYLTNYNYS